MAHLHHVAFNTLRDIVTGIPDFNIDHQELCQGCTLGKYTKASFPSSEHRASGILDLIHSYVCGLMRTLSLSGHEYCVTFIDDFSRKIHFLKT